MNKPSSCAKKNIKVKRISLLAMTMLTVAVVLACSLFNRNVKVLPTREPEPTFEPSFEPVTLPLEIEPSSLPIAHLGLRYEAKLQVKQNVTPVGDISITEGRLPPGLEFVFMEGEDSAVISGIPEETGTYTFTLSVWCFGTQVSGQMLDKEYQIVVEE
jgi:hypothetical protein